MKRIAIASVPLLILAVAALVWANRPDTPPLPVGAVADRVRVDKSERTLVLLSGETVLKRYEISLGGAPEGHKRQEGDERTPEGVYRLDSRNPRSSSHLALHISYPATADSAQAASRGVSPGGMIMIHGIRNGAGWLGRLHRAVDWTDGCIAVANWEMDEIWRAVPVGTPIEIRP